ncbi:MAG TPA: YeiH family protein [Burkholderiaceae bacterium]|jgi:uncharacterized integral membrane protein (TIGR00698 family)|nr:YeiH family protein [Burkholderiaceae bacterium]
MSTTTTLSRFPALAERALPGLALCCVLAAASTWLGAQPWFQSHGLSALTVAIVLGLFAGNTVYPRFAQVGDPGLAFAKTQILRTGVVLYGFRLTLQDLQHLGLSGIAVDALVLGSTFAVAWLIGTRVLGLDRRTAALIGAGSSICGAAAVMATAPVVRARSDQVAVAVAGVVAFGTLSIFLYPLLFSLNLNWQFIPGNATGFGLYIGSTVHEVAQVVAASRAIGPEAANAAIVAKLARVIMLAPFLLMLSAWIAQEPEAEGAQAAPSRGGNLIKHMPWFALAFVGVVLFNSLHWVPPSGIAAITQIDNFLLAAAMAGLGLSTRLPALRDAGVRPMALALVLFVWLVGGGALINRLVQGALG